MKQKKSWFRSYAFHIHDLDHNFVFVSCQPVDSIYTVYTVIPSIFIETASIKLLMTNIEVCVAHKGLLQI